MMFMAASAGHYKLQSIFDCNCLLSLLTAMLQHYNKDRTPRLHRRDEIKDTGVALLNTTARFTPSDQFTGTIESTGCITHKLVAHWLVPCIPPPWEFFLE